MASKMNVRSCALLALLVTLACVFGVTHATTGRYAFKSLSTTQYTAGENVVLTIQVLDSSGRVISSEGRSVTVHATGSALDGPTVVSIQKGVGFIILRDFIAESSVVSLSDTSSTGYDASATLQLSWRPDVASSLTVSHITASAVVGSNIAVTVRAYDLYGNLAVSENANIFLSAVGTVSTVSMPITMTNGMASTTFTFTVPQQVTLTLVNTTSSHDPSLDLPQSITFFTGPSAVIRMDKLVYDSVKTQTSNNLIVGDSVTITIRAFDVFGNPAIYENRQITLRTNGSATGTGAVAFTQGITSITIRDAVAETLLISLVDTAGIGADVSDTQVFTYYTDLI